MNKELLSILQARDDVKITENAMMAPFTSFQIGGPADWLVQPETIEALVFCYGKLKEEGIPVTVIGAGSNLLVADSGIRGAVIRLAKPFSKVERQGDMLIAEAGVSLAKLAAEALSGELSGLEFASGIPGSLGGAVFMNAGAYGGEMKDVVMKTEYVTADGKLRTVEGEAHGFDYRKSIFAEMDCIILRSTLKLRKSDPTEIRATMLDLNNRRREKQPLNYPSAGSFFKRPTGHFAGKLIEDAGLKGTGIGGAQISEKHAGFLINTGGATAEDVCKLMAYVKERVFEQFGVTLEPEVRCLGDFSEMIKA